MKFELHPELWAGLAPNGIGRQKPHHYREMLSVAWDNRAHPKYAWNVLTKGVCDGCALGAAGLHDWTIDGIHLCTTRLRLLELNTADAFDPAVLGDAELLRGRRDDQLRALGRLGYPMRRSRGERGFRRISWDEALTAVSDGLRKAGGDRSALYLTSRGLTNETYYVAGKAARALGITSVDSAARVCHAPSTVALRETIGVAAATCSLRDVIESDLVVIWGANPANNQPVFMKYLYLARRRGTRVVVVNPYLEPGLDRYWVPSNLESAWFGTKMCDLHVPVRPGGDVAFANAALKALIDRGALDERFIAEHTEGWAELRAALDDMPADELLRAAGIDRWTLDAFVDEYAGASAAILLWSMGVTQHRDATDGVRAIVNLGLARGNIGRDGAGLMPLRGHSGVQGGAEMGAYATALPGGLDVNADNAAALAAVWGFPVPDRPGRTAPEMVDAAERGELDVLWCSGGNFCDVLPDPPRVEAALERVPLRVHQDIVVTSQMLVPGDDVSRKAGEPRRRRSGGSPTRRRSRAGSVRLVASGASSPRSPNAPDPTSPGSSSGPTTGRCGPRSPRWCPRTTASSTSIRPVMRSSGAAATCVPEECAPPPPAGAASASCAVPSARFPTACSPSPPAEGSSSTRWCWHRPIRSREPGATRSSSTGRMPRLWAGEKGSWSCCDRRSGSWWDG